MKLIDLQKQTATVTSTATITLGAAVDKFRTVAQAILAGAISAGDSGIPFYVRDPATGAYEAGYYTITSAAQLTREKVVSSSSNNAAVNFGGASCEVYCSLPPDYLAGTAATDLSIVTPVDTHKILLVDSTGFAYTATLSALRTLFGGTAPAADATAPVLSSPTSSATGTTTASGSVTTSEGNGTLYYLATANATETVATVKANGATQTIASAGSKTVNITGLSPSSTYYIHFVQRDAAGNDSLRVTSAAFTTAATGDTTAPTLSSPTATQTGQTTADGSVSTNEANGTLYRYVSTNAVESAATVKAANQTSAVTATGVQSVSFTGLTAGATLYAHYLHRDAAGNDSLVADSASFTTQSGSTAPTAVAYQFNGPKFSPMPTTLNTGSNDFATLSCDFILKTAAGVAPDDTTMTVYAAMSTSTTVMPRPNDAAHTGNGNNFKSCGRISPGDASYAGTYQVGSLSTFKSYGGGTANRYLWVMVFQNGADITTATPIFAAPYDGNHTGTPIAITVT